ncbi:MAG TPA: hypothetical protein VJC01_01875 [Candidatus Paceibacterota bacterium]
MAKKVKARSKIGIAPKIIGAGIAAVVAGIAGAHFLQTAKNRKKLKGWMLKMKGEALERIENLKEATEPAYHKAIDEAAKRYVALKHIDQKELSSVTKELKNHWKHINRQLNKIGK